MKDKKKREIYKYIKRNTHSERQPEYKRTNQNVNVENINFVLTKGIVLYTERERERSSIHSQDMKCHRFNNS